MKGKIGKFSIIVILVILIQVFFSAYVYAADIVVSSEYSISGKYIKGVCITEKVEDFLKNISTTNEKECIVYKGEEKAIATSNMATGMKLKVEDEVYEIVVAGDIAGDGKFTALDLSKLKQHIVGLSKLEGAALEAADTNGKDSVTALDLSMLSATIVGGTSSSDPTPRIPVEKPIIYLYPEESTELSVKLGKPENIICSYPEYNNGWNIVANPDGTLIDLNTGRNLYSLYWEGINTEEFNIKDGFIVKGNEIIEFLEEKLAILGLNEKESEEFIIYWLPRLQFNEYNYIRFASMDEINKNMPLEFSVKPDTIIRVLMQFKSVDGYIDIEEQKLETPERKGFVAVEWGGTEIN